MKGSLHSDEVLGAVIAKETGLRTGRRLSHVFLMDVPTYHKVLIVTDAAINIAPTLEDKVDIVQNAIDLARSFGVERPEGGDPRRGRDGELEDARDARRRGPLQDGRSRADQGRPAGRAAGIRQRHQPRRREDQGHRLGSGRRSRHPAGARSRGRQHDGEAAEFPGQRRQRRHGAGGAGPGHPHQPRRQPPVAHRQLCRCRARGPCRGGSRRPDGDASMDDYALVLNAGSSSLKFCVYCRPARQGWRLECAGADRRHRHVAPPDREGPRPAPRWPTRSSTRR